MSHFSWVNHTFEGLFTENDPKRFAFKTMRQFGRFFKECGVVPKCITTTFLVALASSQRVVLAQLSSQLLLQLLSAKREKYIVALYVHLFCTFALLRNALPQLSYLSRLKTEVQ